MHDPFGFAHTYIRYQTNAQYRFALPVIEQGVCQPDVLWTGSRSVLSFSVDLGDRNATDFWFTRVLMQKESPDTQWVGPEVGLVPLVSASWLRAQGYALDDHGMTNGQIAPLRLTGPGYDPTFLCRKLEGSGDSDPKYEVELLNGTWRNDLDGSYDPIRRIYAISFDPTTVFSDTNAPGWGGSAMKAGEVYFATLQAEAWIWHSAGVSNGLALEWGSGAAAALAHPIRINDQRIWVEWLNGAPLAPRLRVHGNAGLGYTLESSTNLAAAEWFAVATTNASTSPFEWLAPVPTAGHRFYRVRQP